MLEEADFALRRKHEKETGYKAICLLGSIGLNSTFNPKKLPHIEFGHIYIQPVVGDAGTSAGVRHYINNHVLGYPRNFAMNNPFTGP
jgi:predicted NodU family carbamoyl transferase